MNRLYYGDNLDVLRRTDYFPSESVDLVYLDPPFKSDRKYNALFKSPSGELASAQIHAFSDTWRWGVEAEAALADIRGHSTPPPVRTLMESMLTILGKSSMMAYLSMMAPRLLELRRVLKPTGSVYLHCDPSASHYLKLLMDGIFGNKNFLNEIAWCYGLGGSSARYWPRKHDTLLWYSKEPEQQYFVADMIPASSNRMAGQLKKALDYWAIPAIDLNDLIDADYWDIPTINNQAKERLGYPTQKPIDLLFRIIRSSCPEGGIVLDPFCGCGTSVDAAQELQREWVGIDITVLAIQLIEDRLRRRYPQLSSIQVTGLPEDMESARALFASNPIDFERWVVLKIGGQITKGSGDEGTDGLIYFYRTYAEPPSVGRMTISVKGGQSVHPDMVRDLGGTMVAEGTQMGLLITRAAPTEKMREAAAKYGSYIHEATGRLYPVVQFLTVEDLFAGAEPKVPSPLPSWQQAIPAPGPAPPSLF